MVMREFILLALKAKTSPDFNAERLPEEGRLDLVCRTVSNTLWLSNDLRRDTTIHVVMTGPKDPPKIISFNGERLRGLEPDEKSIAHAIKSALKAGLKLNLNEEIEAAPGITVAKKAFETLLKEKAITNQLVYLHPKGKDLRNFEFRENPTFIFGDYIGIPKNTQKLIKRLGAEDISLGPRVLFASHCSIIIHNELDRK